MGDHKPPRAVGERDVLRAAWQYQRDSFVRKVAGVSEEDARRSPVASGTTLLWLAQHLTFAERIWVRQRFGGEDLTDGRDLHVADGVVRSSTLAEAIATYEAEWPLVDAIVDAGDLDAAIGDPNGGEVPVTLRWIVVHLIEEVARHAGHADILRELIDGDTGR
jgi:uncharacterized damage-inducible protein DinB